MVNSIHNQVERRIRSRRRGSVFFADDFTAIGSPDAVKMALSRLAKEGTVVRVAQGIYLYPKVDREMGRLSASIESIAAAIAKRDRARIIPTRVEALNRVGLSTQVPVNAVYLTDGSPRNIKIGKRSILLKKTSPKLLAMKGKISTLAIQAVQALGKDNVTEKERRVIAGVVEKEDPRLLRHDLDLAPAWVAKVIREAMCEQMK